jgi:class 3 adenylate cyclase
MTGRLQPVPPPATDRLIEIAHELERTGWAFEIVDEDWRVVWFSEQLKLTVGVQDDDALGLGRHVLETRLLPCWEGVITRESEDCWGRTHLPFILHADPSIGDVMPPDRFESIGPVQPAPAPSVWTYEVRFARDDGPPQRVSCAGISLREDGCTLGYALLYGPALPASLLALVLRGDEKQFDRMARLVTPRRTQAAILFADLEASTDLSRRLPSRAFFAFIRALASAMDDEVLSRQGIVGKHAGDGVTAFFTVEDLGSPAAAAEAAVQAARAMAGAAATVARDIPAIQRLVDERGCELNAGLHWGAGLYMGQLVTGGRLEVTALGDEVNECARIEQSARAGALLASKSLVEQLGDAEAECLGIDLGGLVYRSVGELPGAGEKAVRDAGGIPVADVARGAQPEPL